MHKALYDKFENSGYIIQKWGGVMKLIKKEHSRYYRALYIASIVNLAANAFFLIPESVKFAAIHRIQEDIGSQPLNLAGTVGKWVLLHIVPALVLFFLARYLKRKSEALTEECE